MECFLVWEEGKGEETGKCDIRKSNFLCARLGRCLNLLKKQSRAITANG